MKIWHWLRLSVSVLALLAGGGIATAGETSDRLIFGATGGLLTGESQGEALALEHGPFGVVDVDLSDIKGGYAALTVGKELSPLWDMRATLGLGSTGETSTTFDYDNDKLGRVTSDFDYQTLDVEAGYMPEMDDQTELRLFAGLRALHYSDKVGATTKLGDVGSESTTDQSSEFWGLGPRAGMAVATRLGDSHFGLSGSAAAGVVLGRLEHTLQTDSNPAVSDSGGAVSYTLDAKAGVDFYMSDDAKLTLGYRAEQIGGARHYTGSDDFEAGQLVSGPYVEFLGSF